MPIIWNSALLRPSTNTGNVAPARRMTPAIVSLHFGSVTWRGAQAAVGDLPGGERGSTCPSRTH